MAKTKLAFIADLHVGGHRRFAAPGMGQVAPLNSRALAITSVLSAARRQAEHDGVEVLYVLGDVFDTADPTPQMVAETQNALRSNSLEVRLLVGNHDQVSDQRGDHSLISMDGWQNLRVIEKPEVQYLDGWQIFAIPYRPGRADAYLLDTLAEMIDGTDAPKEGVDRVMLLHLGLRGPETAPWLANSHDSIDAKSIPRHLIKYTFAGNWHGRAVILPNVIQVGALVPTGFDNPGMTGYGSLVVLDENGPRAAELDGPRFIRATGLKEAQVALEQIAKRVSSWPTYLSIRCAPVERGEARELADLYGVSNVEVLTDKAAAEDAARSAATAAAYASSDSIQAAVAAYVDRMALPDGVTRAEVKRLSLDYVAGASQ